MGQQNSGEKKGKIVTQMAADVGELVTNHTVLDLEKEVHSFNLLFIPHPESYVR